MTNHTPLTWTSEDQAELDYYESEHRRLGNHPILPAKNNPTDKKFKIKFYKILAENDKLMAPERLRIQEHRKVLEPKLLALKPLRSDPNVKALYDSIESCIYYSGNIAVYFQRFFEDLELKIQASPNSTFHLKQSDLNEKLFNTRRSILDLRKHLKQGRSSSDISKDVISLINSLREIQGFYLKNNNYLPKLNLMIQIADKFNRLVQNKTKLASYNTHPDNIVRDILASL